MSITVPTVKVLWTRARDQCAFPGCQQALTEDSLDTTTGQPRETVIGQQAHIRSYKPDGPRYDPHYPASKVHTYQNLILLCPTHHIKVDARHGADFTVGQLVQMRTDHELQHERRERIDKTIRAYSGRQYGVDDKVLFEQVDLNGPSVDSMFVDVPFACRPDAKVADLMIQIAAEHPGDVEATDGSDGQIVTGAAQALLHPAWSGNALLVGGPGQGKTTLLQYICQFHRARLLGRSEYTGGQQQLQQLSDVVRIPIRFDLRKYAAWASNTGTKAKADGRQKKRKRSGNTEASTWPSIEEYIAAEIKRCSGGREFSLKDFAFVVSTRPVLIALDGLDEVANLKYREQVSEEIVATADRLRPDAADLVVLVATRPGTTSALWSSNDFPRLNLQRLSHGLRVQYLQRWAKVARLTQEATDKLQRTFLENQHVPHIRELASYPMQLAILLHLLQRRQLLPQRRTELYSEYLKTFLDREQSEDKEPLLAEERDIIEASHAYIGWYIQTKAEEGKSSGSIKRDELKRVLRVHLAGNTHGQELADKLFSALTTRVLCLVERDPGWFQFDVQSLREYFAATYVFDEGERNSRDDYLIAMLQRPYWSNVCRFFVGKYAPGEVRGIRHLLEELSKEENFGLHPMLRSMAALLLNDRTYEKQKDSPIQEVVDFILDGPGVILAEDGLLDVSGSALLLSERAGRAQAVRHLKARLETEPHREVCEALASSLRRHASAEDDIAGWWWNRHQPDGSWLETAGRLGVLGASTKERASTLCEHLASYTSDSGWAAQVLTDGGYDGTADEILGIVKAEINDGAGDVLRRVDWTSPVGRLLAVAEQAQLRQSGLKGAGVSSAARTRLRGKSSATVLSSIVAASAELRTRPDGNASTDEWQRRLTCVAEAWGAGWVLQQAVAAVPGNVSPSAIAALVRSTRPDLQAVLTAEAGAREHRSDPDWWRQYLHAADNGLVRRHWVFSLLTSAHSPVVVALAGELNGLVDQLTPKHYRAIIETLRASGRLSFHRELVLHEALRLNQVEFSPRTLWLVRGVATGESIKQIDRRLADAFGDLLTSGIGDMRDLARIVGGGKTIRLDTFRGHRTAFPVGGWASNIKIGAMREKVADEMLLNPAEWPGDLVQRAVEKVEDRMLANLAPIAEVAVTENWFADA